MSIYTHAGKFFCVLLLAVVLLAVEMDTTDLGFFTTTDDTQSEIAGFLDKGDVGITSLTNVNRNHRQKYNCNANCPDSKLCFPAGNHDCEVFGKQTGDGFVKCCQFDTDKHFLFLIGKMLMYMSNDRNFPRFPPMERNRLAALLRKLLHKAGHTGDETSISSPNIYDGENIYPRPDYDDFPEMIHYLSIEEHDETKHLPLSKIIDVIKIGTTLNPYEMTLVFESAEDVEKLPYALRSEPGLSFKIRRNKSPNTHLWNLAFHMHIDYTDEYSWDGGIIMENLLNVIKYGSTGDERRSRMTVRQVVNPRDFSTILQILREHEVYGEIEIMGGSKLFKNMPTGTRSTSLGNVIHSDREGHIKITGSKTNFRWYNERYDRSPHYIG